MNAEKLSIYAVFLFRFWKIFFFPAGKSFAKKSLFLKKCNTRCNTKQGAGFSQSQGGLAMCEKLAKDELELLLLYRMLPDDQKIRLQEELTKIENEKTA